MNEVFRLLELESEELNPYILSDEQINAVNEAREQVKKEQFLTHEEAQKKIEQWLNM